MNRFLTSSLGKKVIMGCTGGFLILFLLEHLYTNLLLFAGDGGEAFNEASHSMVHSLFIRFVEIFLFIAIILHVLQAIYLTHANSAARPVRYASFAVNQTSSWFSRNMGITGSVIFFFIVVHLYNFFVPYRLTGEVGPEGHETLAREVAEALANPWYAGIYFISICLLVFHINHGFQSAFQTLGMNNKKYMPVLKIAAASLAVVLWLGYIAFPVGFFIADRIGLDLLNWNM